MYLSSTIVSIHRRSKKTKKGRRTSMEMIFARSSSVCILLVRRRGEIRKVKDTFHEISSGHDLSTSPLI